MGSIPALQRFGNLTKASGHAVDQPAELFVRPRRRIRLLVAAKECLRRRLGLRANRRTDILARKVRRRRAMHVETLINVAGFGNAVRQRADALPAAPLSDRLVDVVHQGSRGGEISPFARGARCGWCAAFR